MRLDTNRTHDHASTKQNDGDHAPVEALYFIKGKGNFSNGVRKKALDDHVEVV